MGGYLQKGTMMKKHPCPYCDDGLQDGTTGWRICAACSGSGVASGYCRTCGVDEIPPDSGLTECPSCIETAMQYYNLVQEDVTWADVGRMLACAVILALLILAAR